MARKNREQEPEPAQEQNGWKIEKKIPITAIITIIVISISVVSGFIHLQAKAQGNCKAIEKMEPIVDQVPLLKQSLENIGGDVEEVKDKMDELSNDIKKLLMRK